jgi:cytochrome c oxidase subunit 4
MADYIVPRKVYFVTYAVLMACTFLTWQVAYIDLGVFNTVAAVVIAVFKMVLVILFFMHVRYSAHRTWLVVAGAFFWLGIMLVVTFGDYLTRGWKTYG